MKWIYLLMLAVTCALSGCVGKKNSNYLQAQQQQQQQQTQQPGAVPRFNPKTVEKIKGQIVNVIRAPYPDARPGYEVQIIVRTADGDIPVRLGPGWYIDEGVALTIGEEVEVKGSKLYLSGMVFIVAQDVKSGKFLLKLRDDKGNPLWTGWRED